ncbi:unnamed protein product [Strongylus vulgaris]|uniref:Uncharacterized protein n=1 Tax=Strongylus vulgaris TaxID=40348 RepID=A0A3P7IGG0_STRVU|nr:unnamed protein product [Strongylus vulgaris]
MLIWTLLLSKLIMVYSSIKDKLVVQDLEFSLKEKSMTISLLSRKNWLREGFLVTRLI